MKQRAAWTFDQFATTLILMAALALACAMPAQSDTFWQLRAGHDIWSSGHVPRVDQWSFTEPGRAWPDHEWLWQAAAYAIHHIGGMPLLAAVNALLAVGAVALVRRLAPSFGRLGILLLILALVPISTAWSIRPQVTSLFLLAVVLTLLAHDRLLPLPVVFLVWANLHAGVSTGGVVVVVATTLAVVLQLLRRTPESRRRMRRLLVVAPLCAVATLLNPLGVGLWSYVLGARDDPAHRFITEWSSVFHLGALAVSFWVSFAMLVAALVVRRQRFTTWPTLLLAVSALVLAPVAMSAVRNVALFVLVALPVVLIAAAPVRPRDHDDVRAARPVLAGFALLGLAAVVTVGVISPPALRWQALSPSAARAVTACPQPRYNDYTEGGYLLWAVPSDKVFVDSRQDNYSYGFLAKAFQLQNAPANRYRPVFAAYGIRCAVVDPTSPIAAQLRKDHWSTSYADTRWAVLLPPK